MLFLRQKHVIYEGLSQYAALTLAINHFKLIYFLFAKVKKKSLSHTANHYLVWGERNHYDMALRAII
jgi:hypothetical protein